MFGRIKATRDRRRINSPGVASSPQPASSPFSTIDPNIQPSGSTATNGFSFGQSQSFPAPTPSFGSTPQSASQSFTFGDQNQNQNQNQNAASGSSFKMFGNTGDSNSSSFNFSTSFGGGQSAGNPFASIPTPSAPTQAPESGFRGFKGNLFSIPSTPSQTDQSKPPAPSTGNIFGTSQSQTSQPVFGAGATITGAPAASTNALAPVFGNSTGPTAFQPPTATTNMFGTPPSEPADDSMQTSPDGPATAASNKPLFSLSGVSQPSFTASTPATSAPGSNMFGNTTPAASSGPLFAPFSTTSSTTTAPASSATPVAADNKPTFASTPATGGSFFGRSTKPEETTATTSAGTHPFSSPAFKIPPASSNIVFKGFGQSKESPAVSTAPEARPASPTKSLMPSTTTPFAAPSGTSLFGFTKKSEDTNKTEPAKESGKDAEKEEPSVSLAKPPLFGVPSTAPVSIPSTSLFSPSKEEPTQTATPQKPATSAFTPNTPFSFTPMTGNLFQTPKSSTPAAESAPKEKPTGTTGSLFQAKPPEVLTSSATNIFSNATPSPNKPMFGNSFATPASPEKTPPETPVPTTPTGSPPKNSFPPPQFSRPAISTDAATLLSPEKPTEKPAAKPATFTPKTRITSYGPPVVPHELDSNERAEYDLAWRVQALNKAFKQKLLEVDPETEDFGALIEYYTLVRQSIGMPLHLANGIKRKASEEELEYPGKRSKVDSTSAPALTSAFSPPSIQERPKSPEKTTASGGTPLSPTPSSTKRKAVDVEEVSSPSKKSPKRQRDTEDIGGAEENNREKKRVNGANADDSRSVSDTVTKFATSFVSNRGPSASLVDYSSSPTPHTNDNALSSSLFGSSVASTINGSGTSGDNQAEGKNSDAGSEGEGEASPPSKPASATGGARSLFDRVEKDTSGKPVRHEKEGNAASSPEKTDGELGGSLFSVSKFSSSFNSPGAATPLFAADSPFDFKSPQASSPKSPFNVSSEGASASSSPAADAQTSEATPKPPSIFATAPSASPSPSASGLFAGGASKSSLFAQPNGSSQPSPFSFSAATSADVSRSTTPALSDAGAEDSTSGGENLPQVDLTRGGVGEEDEDVNHEVRAKAMKLEGTSWASKGVGLLKVLKHKTTRRSRVLLRADPSGKIILNTLLMSNLDYTKSGTSVQFLIPVQGGPPERWAVKVKTADSATKLAACMEECKEIK
ncbi:hypothetical protein AJ80_06570 [Polytolypa hystricis UAMH7299]|uniref:RanBD1 domain-containing protein n=1 Tax=Polytolypa hystricis (strain UAMH7299) TaxID=1447883 RepID=A0A2B7XVS3_POLH7|nr:hypothetical protein AJ80_06570 [Polytolypa hystricis UAMH7299]